MNTPAIFGKPARLIKLKGYVGNSDYNEAKKPVPGKTWTYLTDEEAVEWSKAGGWCGAVIPDDLILIDIDNKGHGARLFAGLKRGGAAFNALETPNGFQFIFVDTGRVKAQVTKFLTVGGFITDYRLQGKGYTVSPADNIKDRRVIHHTAGELSPMPLFFIPVRRYDEGKDRDIIMPETISEGQRNDVLFRHACRLRSWGNNGLGLSEDDRRQIVEAVNIAFCEPSLSTHEIGQIIASAESYKDCLYREPVITSTPVIPTQSLDPSLFLKKGSELGQLEITIEWAIDKLLPKESITLLHGRGGIGKTWVSHIMADTVSKGLPFMGLQSQKMVSICVDFENSLPVLVDRIRKLGIEDVLFWHNTNDTLKPSKLDHKDWEVYKTLPSGSLLIFDTLRAAQGQDENDSQNMAFVMQRLKELRDMGFTILLLHHTPKGNDRTYKGSTAILDLADHVLSLHKVKKNNPEGGEVEDEDDQDCLYRLGTKDKTRYEPFHLFLAFDKDRGFIRALDPNEDDCRDIWELLNEKGTLKQSEVFELVKEELDIKSKGKVVNLLRKGEGKYWTSTKEGRAFFYQALPTVQLSDPYMPKAGQFTKGASGSVRPPRTVASCNTTQHVDSSQLSNCPIYTGTVGQIEEKDGNELSGKSNIGGRQLDSSEGPDKIPFINEDEGCKGTVPPVVEDIADCAEGHSGCGAGYTMVFHSSDRGLAPFCKAKKQWCWTVGNGK